MDDDPYLDPGHDEWGAPVGWIPPVPDAVDLVVEAETMVSVFVAERYRRVEGMRREALADAVRHGYQLTEVIERSVRLELAAALSMTEASAGLLITQADALVNRYPKVLDSLSGARITQRHAVELSGALDAVEPEFRERLRDPALALAESQPVGTFRRKLRTLIETVRSVTLAERHERAVAQRRMIVLPDADGMGWLNIYLPLVEARAIHSRTTAIAKVLAKQPGETRTLDQLRADVTADLLIDGETGSVPPESRGIRATVAVTVPVLALLDSDGDGDGDCDGDGGGIATVEGVGPIPMTRARELAGGAKGWMRVLTHPETGIVLSVGRDRYRPPPELRRLVRWRAETCMAPGCSIPASRCEIDHNIAWEHGGVTALANLCPFCKGHHSVKHHGGWCVEQIPDSGGAVRWISPTGRQYRVEPERRVPVFRPSIVEGPPPFCPASGGGLRLRCSSPATGSLLGPSSDYRQSNICSILGSHDGDRSRTRSNPMDGRRHAGAHGVRRPALARQRHADPAARIGLDDIARTTARPVRLAVPGDRRARRVLRVRRLSRRRRLARPPHVLVRISGRSGRRSCGGSGSCATPLHAGRPRARVPARARRSSRDRHTRESAS